MKKYSASSKLILENSQKNSWKFPEEFMENSQRNFWKIQQEILYGILQKILDGIHQEFFKNN